MLVDYILTDEQKAIKEAAREFAEKEFPKYAEECDREEKFPYELWKKAAELGFIGMSIPEEYGGQGLGILDSCLVVEEFWRVDGGLGMILATTFGSEQIQLFGTEEQKRRFLVPLARGEKLGAFGLTEAGAGSDVAAMETTATRTNGGYVLNGSKLFISNGAEADILVVFATVDRSQGYRGVTAFIVEKGTPGFSVGKHERKLGIRASSTVELIFDNCLVPEENRLGEEGRGFRIALETIDASRIGIAAQAVGIAQAAFEKSLAYAKERHQFGQPIANFQAIQWMLSDMATQIDAARLLTLRAAYLKDRGLPFIKEASMAKLFAAETAMWVTTKAVQVHGGYGYIKDYPLERYFRDAKITEIYEGTSEMQRMTIARQLLRGD